MGKRKAPQSSGAATKRSKSSAAKIAAASNAEADDGWRKVGEELMVYKPGGSRDTSKIAAFDIDSTIITTKSGRVFATGPKDWKFLYAQIPEMLKDLHDDGYKIVFLTNQLGISRGQVSESDYRGKVRAILAEIDCPVTVLAAITTGRYRKPATGMWQHLIEKENGGLGADKESSFYCGDAAGRPEDKGKKIKKDFSSADRLFALNIGLKFKTPEEFFLNETARPFSMPEFRAKDVCKAAKPVDYTKFVGTKQELIVNVGFPASGKSHFSKKYLVPAGYVHVSRDQLGTWQKCVARTREALEAGSSVVVDNTNPDSESRTRYTDLAKEMGIPTRCFYFPVTFEHARHNEVFRQMTDPTHAKIPDMVMRGYKSKFQMPSVTEGFADVVTVPFSPNFKNKKEEELYLMYLLEK